mgnify:CR=1 FL=1
MANKTLTAGVAASAALGVFAATILGFVWVAAWSGFTLSVLWGWFIAPVFSVPTLSVAQAYGLALVLRSVQGFTSQEKSKDDFAQLVGKLLILPPFVTGLTILLGWAIKAWA